MISEAAKGTAPTILAVFFAMLSCLIDQAVIRAIFHLQDNRQTAVV